MKIRIEDDFEDGLIDEKYLTNIPASSVGNPPQIEFRKTKTSLAHLINLSRFQQYHKFLSKKGVFEKELNIIEIGPGYGAAAYNFIKLNNVNSYTLVDLKENLINSHFYLTENFPDWKINLIDEVNPPLFSGKVLNFITADRFGDFFKSSQFDLFINSDSFGEMPRDTAREYLLRLSKIMKEEGIMISMNGHRRGQYDLGGLLKVSDYGYSSFENLSFNYKESFSSSLDDFGHLSIFLNKNPTKDLTKFYDVLGDLFILGVNKDLDSIIDRLNTGIINKFDLEQINLWDDLLNGKKISSNDSISRFIIFIREAIENKTICKEEYEYLRTNLSSPQALYFCELSKLIVDRNWKSIEPKHQSNILRFLFSDALRFKKFSWLKRIIFLEIRRAQMQKIIYPRRSFNLPTILKIRRFITYLSEKL